MVPRVVVGLLAVLGAAGCHIGPRYRVPQAAVNEAWLGADGRLFVGQPADPREWWKSFNDPALNALVDQALRQNLGLQMAALRIVESRARRVIAWELLAPVATATASATHVKFSENVKPNVEVTMPPFPLPPVPPWVSLLKPKVKVSPEMNIYDAGLDAMWEPDIWGSKARGIDAATSSLAAEVASYDDVLVSLVGEVAAAYIELRATQERAGFFREEVKLLQKFLATAEGRAGKDNAFELDVQLARVLLTSTQALLPPLAAVERQHLNRLSVLLGQPPGDLKALVGEGGKIPAVPASIMAGVPADLLRRRPDVRGAERFAAQQCAKVGMATASFFPGLSLIGTLGVTSSDSGKLFASGSGNYAYGVILDFTGPLWYAFLIQGVRMADARYQAAIAAYKDAVLRAAAETEDAMAAFRSAQEQLPFLQQSFEASRRASELATARYGEAKADVAVVIEALRALVTQQDQVVQTRGAAAASLVATYKALGGGWEVSRGQPLLPEDVLKEMRRRSDWWSFWGRGQLKPIPAK